MNKRILTLLIAAVMVVGVLIVTAPTAEAATETLSRDTTSKTIRSNTTLDLNGYDITTLTVNSGVTVYLKDSQTDDYDATNGRGYGQITTISGSGTVVASDGYLLAADGKSAHRLTLSVSGVALRATDLETDGASVYYQCTFGGDSVVKDQIIAYGAAMGAGREPDFRDNTFTRKVDKSAWVTGTTFADNSTVLKGIMRVGNSYFVNKYNGSLDVRCQAYIELADGSRITGDCVDYSLKDIVEGNESFSGVEERWDGLSSTQQAAAQNLYTAFANVINTWSIPRIRQSVTGGAYQIYLGKDMLVLQDKPSASYVLKKNIDMTDIDWSPISDFSGTFDGNSKTISNLTVDTATSSNAGLFGNISSTGKVTNLNLREVQITTSGTSAQYIGTVAGTNSGTITGCTATGTITDTRTGSSSAKIYVGALVGKTTGTVSGGTGLSIRETVTVHTMQGPANNTYITTGLTADVDLNVEDSSYVITGLVGSGTATGLWRDTANSTAHEDAELQRRRQVVVDYVFELGTLPWSPATEIRYYADQESYPNMNRADGSWHIHNQTFTPGVVYYGTPYTHCSSSLEQVKFFTEQNEDGVYVLKEEITTLTGGVNGDAGVSDWKSGNIGWGKYLGTDCSSSLTVGWHKVSPIITSDKTNNGVCLLYSTNMVPSEFNQWYYGFRQIGDYEVDDATWSTGAKGSDVTSGGTTMNDYNMTTEDIFNQIGKEGFYDAYAQTQKGDMLVSYEVNRATGSTRTGHVRMAADDAVVIRDGAGNIDPVKSYFLIHEQGAGLYTINGVSSWRINWKCSFQEMAMCNEGQTFGGNGNGYYIPITMPAFHDTTVASSGGLAESSSIKDTTNPAACAINSSFRIQCATLTIKDASGNVKYENTAYTGTSKYQVRRRATAGSIVMYLDEYFSDYGANLTAKSTYYFTITARTFAMEDDTEDYAFMTDQQFTYSAS